MKIEAVTVCVDYADFLAHTILWNRPQFDRWVIVTTPEDRRTRDLCEHHHVECLTTGSFYDGGPFVKSNGINAGLGALAKDGWVLHLDADIVLPPRTRDLLTRLPLDPLDLYGVDRMMCASNAAWLEYLTAPEVQHSCNTFVQATAFPLGARVGHLNDDGWAPIGFFQLWNPAASGIADYPAHGRADRSDFTFARRWPRERRHLIPEIVAVHIEEKPAGAAMGVNWGGRRSPHFGPRPSRRIGADDGPEAYD